METGAKQEKAKHDDVPVREPSTHRISNGLRIVAGVICALLLIMRTPHIETFGHMLLYLASWITFLHLSIGVYVLVRYLHAHARSQQILDGIAALLLAGGLLTFTQPVLWTSCFAALVITAVLKYALLYSSCKRPVHRQYIREKLLLETPGGILLALAAGIFGFGDLPHWLQLGLQATILAGTTAFAVWMIFIRCAYRKSRLQ